MPTAIQSLDILASELPDVFAPTPPRPDWLEDWIVVPIDDPDKTTNEPCDKTLSPTSWLDGPSEDVDAQLTAPRSPDWNPEVIYPIIEGLGVDGNSPAFGGSPIFPVAAPSGKGVGGHPPAVPPDCYAFYLPIHHYHPDWWGIYLLADGVENFAGEIWRRQSSGARRPLTMRDCRMAARIYLYWHEHYHHQVESFSIRLEVTQRQPLYRNGFSDLYRKTFGTAACLEETLAEAWAYLKTIGIFKISSGGKRITAKERRQSEQKGKALDRALRSLIKCSPEGYRQAIKILKGPLQRSGQNEFAELCHQEALPHLVTLAPSIWGNSPYAFDGFGNVRSRVNYLIPRHSPIAARIPLEVRPRITHRELIRGLRKLKPKLKETSAGGKHPTKLKAPGGRAIPIPTHPGDMSNDTIRKILRQAGLDMGIRQFLDSI